jgi:tetratricopeptide (TPR) repeat protein
LGRDRQAVETLRTCLAVNPSDPYARNQLAWILATSSLQNLRSPEEALRHAQAVCEATGHANPVFLETLAAALAASNRFEEAVETQRQALRLSPPPKKKSARTRLELYRLNKPLIQSPPNPRRRN